MRKSPALCMLISEDTVFGDIEFVAAFDVDATPVGSDLSEAIFASQNNTYTFSQVPSLGVEVLARSNLMTVWARITVK